MAVILIGVFYNKQFTELLSLEVAVKNFMFAKFGFVEFRSRECRR